MILRIFLPAVVVLASFIGVGSLIHGCVNHASGAIRIASHAQACTDNENPLQLGIMSFLPVPATGVVAMAQPQQFSPSSYLPLLQKNDCRATRLMNNFIGLQIYGPSGHSRNTFTLLQNTQSSWLRNNIMWVQVEPTDVDPSQYYWGGADAALQAVVDSCANLIVTIDDTPAWAVVPDLRAPIRPEALDDFREFVTAVVERYDGDGTQDAPNGAVVNYWEFYNEPDWGSKLPDYEGWGDFGAQYAEMLKTVYDAVHAANPNAKVVFGGIAYNFFEEDGGVFIPSFFEDVLAAGGGDYFDIMNFHYYPYEHNLFKWTQTNSSGLREKYANIKEQMEEAHIGDKPVMITEMGWHSDTTNAVFPSSPEYQARRVVELLAQSASLEVMSCIWWLFSDTPANMPYSTGLVTTNGPTITIKPSYAVYAEAVKRLGAAKFDAVISAATEDNDLEAYRFIDAEANQPFYVAWLNPVVPFDKNAVPKFDDDATEELIIDADAANIYNKEGTLQQTIKDRDDKEDDGKITVVVGRSPIYIVVQ